ncbi:MAG TPA: ABC transporter ATP-binding protein [Pyrinomonadaceae bacterium]|jgi:ABC-2 type transport system ATP-binding protein
MACANIWTPDKERGDIVAEPAISIRNLSKTYPIPFRRLRAFFRRPVKEPVEALRDVSFEVQTGEIFGLIGRNGAGKTTLTKIVATLVQPTTGSVSVRDNDSVVHDEQVRRQIGLATAEERSFYWRLTAEQNLMFFARLHGLTDRIAKQRIKELFAQLELDEVARRRFGEMSTGNKQRLAVARAMLSMPPVLLLDEPTRSLDPLAAARMRGLISSLAEQDPPVTILLTSHNLAEVETLCSRVAIISRGRIRAIDTPQHLRSLTSKSEQVHVTVAGLNGADAPAKVSFTRQAGDNQLDDMLRDLQKHGGRILDVEVEKGSLLDALELYESDDKTE